MQKTYGIGLIGQHDVKPLNLPLMTKAQAQQALDTIKVMTQDSMPNVVLINRESI